MLQTVVATSSPTDPSDVNQAIHVEPGTWMYNPKATDSPLIPPSYVRLASVPHGVSLMLSTDVSGTAGPGHTVIQGPPQYPPRASITKRPGAPGVTRNNGYGGAELPPNPVTNPNAYMVLQQALAAILATNGDTVKQTTVIKVGDVNSQAGSSDGRSDFAQTVFLGANAKTTAAEMTLYIIQTGKGNTILQYVQQVMLFFDFVDWPHITVGTLVRSGGVGTKGGAPRPKL